MGCACSTRPFVSARYAGTCISLYVCVCSLHPPLPKDTQPGTQHKTFVHTQANIGPQQSAYLCPLCCIMQWRCLAFSCWRRSFPRSSGVPALWAAVIAVFAAIAPPAAAIASRPSTATTSASRRPRACCFPVGAGTTLATAAAAIASTTTGVAAAAAAACVIPAATAGAAAAGAACMDSICTGCCRAGCAGRAVIATVAACGAAAVLLLLRSVAGFCSSPLSTLQPLDDLIALWQISNQQ